MEGSSSENEESSILSMERQGIIRIHGCVLERCNTH